MNRDGDLDQADRERAEHTELLRRIARNTGLWSGLPEYDPSWDPNLSRTWGMLVVRYGHLPGPRFRTGKIVALLGLILLAAGALVIFGLGGML